jgi:hypothetical protein
MLNKFRFLITEYYGALIIQVLVFTTYCSVIFISYIYTNDALENRKNEILNDYYGIILNHSVARLDNLLQKLPDDARGKNVAISLDKSNVLSCYKQRCITNNLFEFASSVDKQLPSFIYYKIDINNHLLHCNNKVSHYELEKTYHVNDYNQLAIAISIDSKYWNKIKAQIAKPFLVTVMSSTVLLILFISSRKLLSKYFKKFYFSYFNELYNSQLETVKANYQNELVSRENSLIRKIWNLEYSKEKDAELNYLFSQEAIQLAASVQELEYLPTNNKRNYNQPSYKHSCNECNYKNLPCSIILYYSSKNLEKIDTKSLIEIFSNRFVNLEDNILVSITSSEQSVEFASRASLYQIIYSVINYIIFILKDQSCVLKYSLKLDILNKNGNLRLLFKYDGLPLHNEEEVFRFSNKFFRNYANPFLLGLNQIFDILKANNFYCKLGYNNLNFIEITKKVSMKGLSQVNGNIIRFPKYE